MKMFIIHVLLSAMFFGGLAYLIVTPEPDTMPHTEELRQQYVQNMHEKEVNAMVQEDLYHNKH